MSASCTDIPSSDLKSAPTQLWQPSFTPTPSRHANVRGPSKLLERDHLLIMTSLMMDCGSLTLLGASAEKATSLVMVQAVPTDLSKSIVRSMQVACTSSSITRLNLWIKNALVGVLSPTTPLLTAIWSALMKPSSKLLMRNYSSPGLIHSTPNALKSTHCRPLCLIVNSSFRKNSA